MSFVKNYESMQCRCLFFPFEMNEHGCCRSIIDCFLFVHEGIVQKIYLCNIIYEYTEMLKLSRNIDWSVMIFNNSHNICLNVYFDDILFSINNVFKMYSAQLDLKWEQMSYGRYEIERSDIVIGRTHLWPAGLLMATGECSCEVPNTSFSICIQVKQPEYVLCALHLGL